MKIHEIKDNYSGWDDVATVGVFYYDGTFDNLKDKTLVITTFGELSSLRYYGLPCKAILRIRHAPKQPFETTFILESDKVGKEMARDQVKFETDLETLKSLADIAVDIEKIQHGDVENVTEAGFVRGEVYVKWTRGDTVEIALPAKPHG